MTPRSSQWRTGAFSVAVLAATFVVALATTRLSLGSLSIALYEGTGFALGLLVIATAIRAEPRTRRPWLLLGAAILLCAAGDLIWDLTELLSRLPGFTSRAADVAYFASYPVFLIATFGLLGLRGRRRDRVVLLDGAIIATAAWLVLWTLWVYPSLATGSPTIWDWLPTALYPPLDVLVLVALWRVGRGDLRLSPPWLLLFGAFALMFVADVAYAVLGMPSGGVVLDTLNCAWLMSYGAIAAAALHPAMPLVKADPEPVTRIVPDRARIIGLVGAVAVPFGLLLVAPEAVANISVVLATCGLLLALGFGVRLLLSKARSQDAEKRLAYQATHDTLTGLSNRAALLDHLGLAIRRGARRGSGCAVLFIDLDDFKVVNDSLGHTAGDELLQAVAGRLRATARTDDYVARLGGDEFVVVCENVVDRADAESAAGRIFAAMERAFLVRDVELVVGASIGMVIEEHGDAPDPEAMLRDADVAMYHAKEHGRGKVEAFDAAMRQRVLDRLDIDTALRHAVERNELRLDYQPIVRSNDLAPIATEALLRWQRAPGTLVQPDDFIGMAEKSGAIVEIGGWVIEESTRALARANVDESFAVAINVSPRQLEHPGMAIAALAAAREAALDPRRVICEITESALVEPDPTVDSNLETLVRSGFQLAIDDFGTGYSSLAYLKRLAVQWIKVDRMFVQGLGQDDSDETLVRTIILMAHELNIRVIAEGVETALQLEMLRTLGCDAIQGFFLHRPARTLAKPLRGAKTPVSG